MPRPKKACLDIGANNYGFDNNGNYIEDADTNEQTWCTFDNPMDEDEESLAEEIGSENFTTHEEAITRGLENNDSDWARNRRKIEEEARIAELKKALPIVGLGLLTLFGGIL